jgi:hypothetical protein
MERGLEEVDSIPTVTEPSYTHSIEPGLTDPERSRLEALLGNCKKCGVRPKHCNCELCKECIEMIIRKHAKPGPLEVDMDVMTINRDTIMKKLRGE